MSKDNIQIPDGVKPPATILEEANKFTANFRTFENKNKIPHLLLFDIKSGAYYLLCHLDSESLSKTADLDAVLDPFESEEYKLNRDIYIDTYAYKFMESDALKGRSFEDIVVEYDTSDNIFPPAWDILREHFEKKLPNYIVDTAPSNYRRYGRYPMSRYPYLQNIVQTHYVLFAQLRGFDIYLLRDDHETN